MKRILLILLCLPIITLAQQTYVPDDIFEQYLINNGYDNILNDSVSTASLQMVTHLDFSQLFGSNVSDFTGIEECVSLIYLNCGGCSFSSIDLSNNLNLEYLRIFQNNDWLFQQTPPDLSNNLLLSYLNLNGSTYGINTNYQIDLSYNINLDTLKINSGFLQYLDLTNNINLSYLDISYNSFQCLDLSYNQNLKHIEAEHNPMLEFLNLSNINLNNLSVLDFPNIAASCIEVDNPVLANSLLSINPGWDIHQAGNPVTFATDCNYTSNIWTHAHCADMITSLEDLYDNKSIIKVVNIFGQYILNDYDLHNVLFYIYKDGTVEKRITVE